MTNSTPRNRGVPLADEETRYWPAEFETRSVGKTRTIRGLGVPYNQRSRMLPGGFYEIVEPRSMAKTLGDRLNVACRLEHHPEWLLATTDSDTMRLIDGETGMSFEADLPNTAAGRDAFELIDTGRIRHSSMGFINVHDEFRHQGATVVRHLIDIRLTEISPCAQPVYSGTSASIAVRSLAAQLGEDPADVEAIAARGELRSLFPNTGDSSTVIDLAPSTPTPRDVAERTGGMDIELARARSRNRARTSDGDPIVPPKVSPVETLELLRARNASIGRQIEMDDAAIEDLRSRQAQYHAAPQRFAPPVNLAGIAAARQRDREAV